MKLTGFAAVLVLVLVSTGFAVTPMAPDQQYQAMQLRIAQFSARYLAFHDDVVSCGGTVEPSALWQQSDAAMNAWLIQTCGSVDNYDIPSNQCINGAPLMTPSQQYQTLLYQLAQFEARYAALEHAAIIACGGMQNLPPAPASWAAADSAMNAYLLQMCGGFQHYSTSQNQCK